MRGSRVKALRRAVYGPREDWTEEGYFPNHPSARGYTIMKTYQKVVPRLFPADEDPGTDKEKAASIKLPGPGGKMMNYRYVPWTYHGETVADIERRKYQWAKRNWKRFKRLDLHRGW